MKFKLGNLVWFMPQIRWILFGICFLGSSSSSHGVAMAMAMSHNISFGPSLDDFFPNFDISIVPSGENYYGTKATLDNNKTVWLIPDPNTSPNLNRSATRVVSKQPIRFLDDTGAIVSFDTSFSFQIITQSNLSGEGLAFFIAQDKAFPHNSAGSYLGLSNDTFIQYTSFPGHNFFAVEFDIAKSPEFNDPSSSHVGIDINSLRSIHTIDTSGDNNELSLHQDFRFQTWITFNASTNLVQVWLMNYGERTDYANSLERTAESLILQAFVDPSVFNDTSMWVGITATSGSLDEFDHDTKPSGYAIYSWYFATFGEAELIDISPRHSPSYHINNSSTESLPYNGNNYPHPPVSKKGNFGLILGISFSLLFLMVIMGFTIIVYKNGGIFRPKKSELYPAHEAASADIQQFSYNVLKRATHNFSDKMLLGEGGYSKVYKGILPNDECSASRQLVAIKKLKENVKEGGEASFASEVRIISNRSSSSFSMSS